MWYILAGLAGALVGIIMLAVVSSGTRVEEIDAAYKKGFGDGVRAQRKIEDLIATSTTTIPPVVIPGKEET